MAATFLYCIGAAKAGTTWLARALRNHDQAALPPIKETHYFDSVENGSSIWALDQLIRVRSDVRAEMAASSDDKTRARNTRRVQEIDRWLALVGAQRRNDAMYQKLMMRPVGPAHRVVADVTPAYALLKSDTYARMAALNEGRTRFLMILRDPVDRLWSNIAMTVTRRTEKGMPFDAARAAVLAEVTRSKDNPERARSDYVGTLDRLENAVPADQRMVLFFEDLFQSETLTKLSRFLGLDTPLEGPKERINAGTGLQMNSAERSQLADLLRPQYSNIQSRLGSLPQRWQDNLEESMVTS
ncbi:MAG: sulfotransferase [Tateyamaria sp.]|uniref:sulfotransferase n=1 Tax=Tateyamaria sp. TaxID=1929288 RepID=UPI00329CC2AF